jgi:hypothetical protein
MKSKNAVQYISDAEGRTTGVILPIELWREIASERETAYLLQSDAMRDRLLGAMNRTGGLSLDEVQSRLGI